MTCIVLVQNQDGGVLAITEGATDQIAQFDSYHDAKEQLSDQPLIKAWGGFVVDLTEMAVREI